MSLIQLSTGTRGLSSSRWHLKNLSLATEKHQGLQQMAASPSLACWGMRRSLALQPKLHCVKPGQSVSALRGKPTKWEKTWGQSSLPGGLKRNPDDWGLGLLGVSPLGLSPVQKICKGHSTNASLDLDLGHLEVKSAPWMLCHVLQNISEKQGRVHYRESNTFAFLSKHSAEKPERALVIRDS